MIFKKKKLLFKHVDKLITWVIIGWAVWSIFYKRKTTIKNRFSKIWTRTYSSFGKWLVFVLNIFKKKKK